MIHNIGLNQAEITWNYPSWSISVEFWVNVLFIACITRRSPSAALLAVSLLGLSVIYFHTGHLDVTTENYFLVVNSGMLRGLSSFLLGILAYRIYLKVQSVEPTKVVGNLLETGSVLLALVTISYRCELHSSLDFLAPFVFLLVVVVFALESGMLSAGLKKLNYLGEISYSIYLNQITVSQVLIIVLGAERIPEIPMVWLLSIFLGTLILYSCLTYETIENPLRRKSRPRSSSVA
jgi:peptidoglycan/LPS O-acetylase OafA/YrhL